MGTNIFIDNSILYIACLSPIFLNSAHWVMLFECRDYLAVFFLLVQDRSLNGIYFVGFCLFLGFLIDRMHHYLRKLIGLRSAAGASRKEIERLEKDKLQLKEKSEKADEEMKVMKKEISDLIDNLNKLKMESAEKHKKVEIVEAHVAALQKQAADLLLEYDRLLEDNQNLQNQAVGYRG